MKNHILNIKNIYECILPRHKSYGFQQYIIFWLYVHIHDFIFLPWLYISYEHQNCYSYELCKSPQNTKHIQEVINIPNRIDSIQKQGRRLKTASSFFSIYLLIVTFSSFEFHITLNPNLHKSWKMNFIESIIKNVPLGRLLRFHLWYRNVQK